MWGYAKDNVNADKPLTPEHLKIKICKSMAEVPPKMCKKVVENDLKRFDAGNNLGGGHLNDVVFHT